MNTDLVRQFLLEEFPNPERKDCTPEAIIKAISDNRLPADDAARLHLAECSECFAEFRSFKVELEQKRIRNIHVMLALAASLILAVVGLLLLNRSHAGLRQAPQEIAHGSSGTYRPEKNPENHMNEQVLSPTTGDDPSGGKQS